MSDKKINDGGPAFPGNGEQFVEGVHGIQPQGAYGMQGAEGMSLRDYFAAKVLPEIYRQYARQANAKNQWDVDWQMYLAVDAYQMADAMIAARDHSPNT